mmetsp:Transcript_19958/g.61966  ORF Transcript_19958/g.61966 Transcript_19958/m.61966 type:complete len:247 (-) Transcript_19958:3693-4433(-)
MRVQRRSGDCSFVHHLRVAVDVADVGLFAFRASVLACFVLQRLHSEQGRAAVRCRGRVLQRPHDQPREGDAGGFIAFAGFGHGEAHDAVFSVAATVDANSDLLAEADAAHSHRRLQQRVLARGWPERHHGVRIGAQPMVSAARVRLVEDDERVPHIDARGRLVLGSHVPWGAARDHPRADAVIKVRDAAERRGGTCVQLLAASKRVEPSSTRALGAIDADEVAAEVDQRVEAAFDRPQYRVRDRIV